MFIVNFVFSAGTISSFYGTVDDVEYKYHTNNNNYYQTTELLVCQKSFGLTMISLNLNEREQYFRFAVYCLALIMQVGFIGLVEEEWLVTLATVDREEVTYLDFVMEGTKLAKELREEVRIMITILIIIIYEPVICQARDKV